MPPKGRGRKAAAKPVLEAVQEVEDGDGVYAPQAAPPPAQDAAAQQRKAVEQKIRELEEQVTDIMEEMWAAALKQVDRMRTDFHLLCVTVPAKVRATRLSELLNMDGAEAAGSSVSAWPERLATVVAAQQSKAPRGRAATASITRQTKPATLASSPTATTIAKPGAATLAEGGKAVQSASTGHGGVAGITQPPSCMTCAPGTRVTRRTAARTGVQVEAPPLPATTYTRRSRTVTAISGGAGGGTAVTAVLAPPEPSTQQQPTQTAPPPATEARKRGRAVTAPTQGDAGPLQQAQGGVPHHTTAKGSGKNTAPTPTKEAAAAECTAAATTTTATASAGGGGAVSPACSPLPAAPAPKRRQRNQDAAPERTTALPPSPHRGAAARGAAGSSALAPPALPWLPPMPAAGGDGVMLAGFTMMMKRGGGVKARTRKAAAMADTANEERQLALTLKDGSTLCISSLADVPSDKREEVKEKLKELRDLTGSLLD